MDQRPKATHNNHRNVMPGCPGTQFERKYFTSPVNTLRATIKQCRRPGKPLSPLRQNSDHLTRSEEHTSELQSHSDLVCRLLLEKKKSFKMYYPDHHHHNTHRL